MTGTAVTFRAEKLPNRDFGTKNALARMVRNRWRSMPIENVRAEWGLTEGEARGVVYAQASQRTVDKILKHPRGGWRVALELLEHTIGESLSQFIDHERARLAEEQRRAEEDAHALAQVASRLPALLGGNGSATARRGMPRSLEAAARNGGQADQ